MSTAILVALVLLWAAVLLPGSLRGRQPRSPRSSVHAFERSMVALASDVRGRGVAEPVPPGLLGWATPGRPSPSMARRRVLGRRRVVLQGLVGGVTASGLLSVAVGGAMTGVFLGSLALLLAYVGVLAQLRSDAEHARRTVRRLPVDRRARAGRPARGPEPMEAPGLAVGDGWA